jgi:hypothetical protein
MWLDVNGVYDICAKADHDRDMFVFGPANRMQPDPFPDLPELEQVEDDDCSHTCLLHSSSATAPSALTRAVRT